MNRGRVLFAAAMSLVAIAMQPAMAAPIQLEAVEDSQFRIGSGGNSNYNASATGKLTVWSNRHSIFQFDLSNLAPDEEITAAHLEVYPVQTTINYLHPIEIHLVYPTGGASDVDLEVTGPNNLTSLTLAFDADGMHEEYVSGTSYSAAIAGSWDASRQVSLEFAPGPGDEGSYAGNAGYVAGGSADAAVLQILNEAKNSRGYIIVAAFAVGDADTVLSDRESGFAPRLVVETQAQVPEPSTYALLGLGSLGLLALRRRRVA